MASRPAIPINTTGGVGDVDLSVTGLTGTGLSLVDNGDGSGEITGTIATGASSGSPYMVTITAGDDAAQSDTEPFSLTVSTLPLPPGATFDVSAEDLVLSEGATVSTWDSTGINEATVSSVTGTPSYSATSADGNPGVTFLAGEALEWNATVHASGTRTLVNVLSSTQTSGGDGPYVVDASLSRGRTGSQGAANWQTYYGNASFNATRVPSQLQVVVTRLKSDGSVDVWVDGVREVNSASSTFLSTGSLSGYTMAGDADGTMVVARAIVYDSALTDDECEGIASTLMSEYGL